MMGETYKKRMQLISFGIGLGVAIALNINTLSLASHLYQDADARTSVAELATGLVQDVSTEDFATCSRLDPAALRQNPDCAGLTSLIDGLRQRSETFGQLCLSVGRRAPWLTGACR